MTVSKILKELSKETNEKTYNDELDKLLMEASTPGARILIAIVRKQSTPDDAEMLSAMAVSGIHPHDIAMLVENIFSNFPHVEEVFMKRKIAQTIGRLAKDAKEFNARKESAE